MKKSYWLGVAVIIILIIIGTGVNISSQHNSAESIRIGFIGPLSGFGAAWGEEVKWAIDTAVSEINDKGGIDGKPIRVIYEDGKCDSKDAITSAQKLISIDKVSLLFTQCGQESLSVAPIAEQNKVLMMSLWSTHPKLTGIGDYIFRNSYSDEDTGRIMADVISSKYPHVAVASELNDYCQGLLDMFKKYYTGSIVAEENFPTGTKDFKTQALYIISKKPDAVLVNPADASSGLALIKQLRQLGYKGPLFGNYFGSIGEVLTSPDAQGMVFFTDPDVKDNTIKDAVYKKFAVDHSGSKPNFDFAVAVSYDSVYILKQAITAVGTDTSKLKDYLHNLRGFTGIMGTYGFNDKGDASGYEPSIKQIVGGVVVNYDPQR